MLVARFTSLWLSRRQFPIVCHRHRHCPQLEISSSSEPKELEEDDDVFLPWLEEKAGFEISSVLSIGKSENGRCLFASRDIRSGDSILKVPFHVQISPDNLHPEVRKALSDEVGSLAKLAIAVLLEQKAGQDSRWHPYISRLPRLQEMHNTIFWSKSELEMIRKSPVFEETINQKNQIEREFSAIRRVSNFLIDANLMSHDILQHWNILNNVVELCDSSDEHETWSIPRDGRKPLWRPRVVARRGTLSKEEFISYWYSKDQDYIT